MNRLSAGAGSAVIRFPENYFPQFEKIGSVYQDMHIRSILLDGGDRVLLISAELPSLRPFAVISGLREIAADIADVPFENVWLCVTHSLAAPHVPPEGTEAFTIHMNAVEDALRESVASAVDDMQPARFGRGTGKSDIIVGRHIHSLEGWWNGIPGPDPSDPSLEILRFDNLEGKPIAFIWNHGVKSCVMENAFMADGYRVATPDLCGMGSSALEEQFGVPALFFMGAGGDQFPKKMAVHGALDAEGHYITVKCGEEACGMLAELGSILGHDLTETASGISCADGEAEVRLKQISFTAPGKQVYDWRSNPMPPIQTYTYIPAEDEKVTVDLLRIADTAIVGVKSEVTTPVMRELRKRTPIEDTLVFTMVNGGQSYIADDSEYDRFTFPGLRTMLARGTDRLFLEHTAEALKTMK